MNALVHIHLVEKPTQLFHGISIRRVFRKVNYTGGTVSSTPSPSTSSPSSSYSPFTNIIKFVASGGLSGPYTITEIDNGPTNSEYLQSAKILQIDVSDSNWKVVTGVVLYSGPNSYKTTDFQFGPSNNTDITKSWIIGQAGSTALCPLSITSDMHVNTLLKHNVNEIKGTFSCASLPSGSHPPITISNGQFDLFVNQMP
jgi:hypothetical protein